MSTELALPSDLFADLPVAAGTSIEAIQEIAPASNFFSYLQLLQPLSKGVTEHGFKAGEFVYSAAGSGKQTPIGSEFVALPVSWRQKAMMTAKNQNNEIYYDPNNPRFTEIRDIALNSKGLSDCMFGPEFLFWIPELSDFVSFFLVSKTLRNSAPSLAKYMQPIKPVLIKSNKIQKEKNTWFGVLVEESLVQIENLPDRDNLVASVTKFTSDKGTEIKQIAVEGSSDRER